jgi:hypothetical protein
MRIYLCSRPYVRETIVIYEIQLERCLLSHTHINLHFLINSIVHDQAMRQSYSVRLHRMARNVGIISNIRVVEICDSLLGAGSIRHRV